MAKSGLISEYLMPIELLKIENFSDYGEGKHSKLSLENLPYRIFMINSSNSSR